jgi:16S rRNA (cytosine1402-N4)-methyltransferase
MYPQRGQPVSALLERIRPEVLETLLRENADEPRADTLAAALAGRHFPTTTALAKAVAAGLPRSTKEEGDLAIRRVFQALRIAVNDEFSALETLLRHLPACLKPGGRAAVLTFHSGEDRRVKTSFEAARRDGIYAEISEEVVRAAAVERRSNPRSMAAKLRWARLKE